MRKTSLYLADEDVARLQRLATREGKSKAQIIREALEQYQPAAERPRSFYFFDAIQGSWDSTGRSVADIPEEELLAVFGEDGEAGKPS